MADIASKVAFAPTSNTKAETTSTSQKSSQKQSQTSNKTSSKLEEQAASAALHVTKKQGKSSSEESWLDSNNKLSSAGAAASLKYAQPKDLPSYPSSGLPPNASAAGAAATLGWANQKSFEHWKPDPSSAASTAASLANDYKLNPAWQPQQSANGAKAALLAARDATKVEAWKPESSAWSNSAANLAVQGKKKEVPSQTQIDNTKMGRQGSLLAATGAMAGSRRRAESTPTVAHDTYPDQSRAVANALSAATVAHKPSTSAKPNAAITNMGREMYTSHPPVGSEVEEKERANMLRASAVAMAQKMYSIQQKSIDAAAKDLGLQAATSAADHRRGSNSVDSDETAPMQFNNLQEAAQKLAQKRLSKLHDEHAQAREYREYYGESKSKFSPVKRLSMGMHSRGRPRQRASSLGADDDKEQSNMIRAKMSMFSSNVSQVDAKKRQEDREALIAIAQRNVAKSLHGMDERVFQDTGKMSSSMRNEWEVKAQAAAQTKSDERMLNHGKVNIGGGKFVDQSVVDQAAARNVRPALDDLNEKAAAEHARQVEAQADLEATKRAQESNKLREKEEKEIQKKLNKQEGTPDKRKSGRMSWLLPKLQNKDHSTPSETVEQSTTLATDETPITPTTKETTDIPATEDTTASRLALDTEPVTTVETDSPVQEDSSPKNSGRVKSWLKTTFASVPHTRRASKSLKSSEGQAQQGPFIGGAALTGASNNDSQHSISNTRGEEIGLSGAGAEAVGGVKGDVGEERVGRSKKRGGSVGSVDGEGKEEFEEARDNFDDGELLPPSGVGAGRNEGGSQSPARETKFREDIS